jgi:hypothetical protein
MHRLNAVEATRPTDSSSSNRSTPLNGEKAFLAALRSSEAAFDDLPPKTQVSRAVAAAFSPRTPLSHLICKTRTPTVSGEVQLGAHERLSVVIDGVVYGPNQGLVIRAGVWSVTIPREHSLDAGLYRVTALVCDDSGRVTHNPGDS